MTLRPVAFCPLYYAGPQPVTHFIMGLCSVGGWDELYDGTEALLWMAVGGGGFWEYEMVRKVRNVCLRIRLIN